VLAAKTSRLLCIHTRTYPDALPFSGGFLMLMLSSSRGCCVLYPRARVGDVAFHQGRACERSICPTHTQVSGKHARTCSMWSDQQQRVRSMWSDEQQRELSCGDRTETMQVELEQPSKNLGMTAGKRKPSGGFWLFFIPETPVGIVEEGACVLFQSFTRSQWAATFPFSSTTKVNRLHHNRTSTS